MSKGLAFAFAAALAAAIGFDAAPTAAQSIFDQPRAPRQAAPQPQPQSAPSSQTQGSYQAPAGIILNQPVPMVMGPKRVVAVGKFDSIGAFRQQYGEWDIGGGLAAMLTSALQESGRFIVLERANIQQILSEQELKAQKITAEGSGPGLRQVTGVNFMIYGAVTEFGTDDSGGGLNLGFSGGPLGKLMSAGVSRQSSSGKVAMDIRIVDTTTTEVLEIYKVAEEITNEGFDLSLGYRGVSFGGNEFMKTPIGGASRKAINRAVQLIAGKANETPWSGQVVDVDKKEVYVNAGRLSGLKVGDRMQIERITRVFTDPATGQVIGKRKQSLGAIELTGVEDRMSYGNFVPLSNVVPERGDLVLMQ